MLRKSFILLTALVAGLFAGPATALAGGAFGISADTPFASLDLGRRGEYEQYDLKSVPEPDPLFVRYGVQAAEGIGVCQVSALTRTFTGVGEMGVAARSRQVVDVISHTYGPPDDSFPGEHLTALKLDPLAVLNDRSSRGGYYWSSGDDGDFASGINMVSLELVSIDNSHYAFIADFTFPNQRECNAVGTRQREQETFATLPQTCWLAPQEPLPPGTSAGQSICFDGHGEVTTTSWFFGPEFGGEAMEAGGRYWGTHGRIHFSGEGDAWPWQWQDLACDLTETETEARLSNCEGIKPHRYGPDVPGPIADEAYLIEQ